MKHEKKLFERWIRFEFSANNRNEENFWTSLRWSAHINKRKGKKHAPTFVVTELNLMDDITVSIAMYLHCFFDLSTEQKP